MAGADPMTVKELLGHKTLAMTLRYSHLAPAHRRRAVNLLDEALNERSLGLSSPGQKAGSACRQGRGGKSLDRRAVIIPRGIEDGRGRLLNQLLFVKGRSAASYVGLLVFISISLTS